MFRGAPFLTPALAVALSSAGLLAACGSTEEPPPFEPWTLEDLTAGEGFSLRTPAFDLEPGQESQTCYFVRVPDLNNGQPYFISRVHIAQNPGTHHLNVFRVNSIIDLDPAAGEPIMLGEHAATVQYGGNDFEHHPCWKSSNWADWPLIANSQTSEPDNPYYVWQLPASVGIKLMPGEMLMVQSHYVNYGVQETPFGVRVGVNFHRTQGSTEPVELGSLFATQQSIRVCQSTGSAKFSGVCRFPAGTHTIEAANGHFHSRGKQFTVYTWDGFSTTQPPESQHFYTSNAWDDPPMMTNIGAVTPEGGGVWWNCEYQWAPPTTVASCDDVNAKDAQQQGDCCYTFGGNVDVGEHCNLFLYYYPRVDENDVFCN
ncbi:MAG: hypothetical protein IT384_10895 [Deltaproteobacteria bacterium]|nr:hypothetical protein [Deltaproteobacteria bacterium]